MRYFRSTIQKDDVYYQYLDGFDMIIDYLEKNHAVCNKEKGLSLVLYTKDIPIKRLRIEHKLTQQQLADKAGVHINIIQRFESRERAFEKASVETAHKIAVALNVKIEDLID